MNRSLLLAITAACQAAAGAVNAAPADRYSYGPAAPAAEAKPLWKRIIALEWIDRAPMLTPALRPAYPATASAQTAQPAASLLNWSNKPAPTAQGAQMAAVSATPQRLPGGLYSQAISQVQSAPAAAPSAPAQPSLTGVAPSVDPRPRQAPQLP